MNKEIKTITHKLLRSWGPCKDGYKRFCELFPDGADLQTAIDGLLDDNFEDNGDDWAYWLFNECEEDNIFNEVVLKGYRNSGNRNSGDVNSGDRNSGDVNSGDRNSGYRNSGNWNSGDWNSGCGNSGDVNSGDRNSGDRNSGDRNSGDWNSGCGNSGFFNSETPKEVLVFNKPVQREVWVNAYKPNILFFDLNVWVRESDMTEEEKKRNSNFYVLKGYLKTISYKDAWKLSWNNSDKKDRIKVKDLPNFDANVFYKITGIDLRNE